MKIDKPLFLGLVILLVAVGAVHGSSASEELTFDRTIERGAAVVVKNIDGDIEVSVWDRPQVRVVARKRVEASGRKAADRALEALRVTVIEQGGDVVVRTDRPETEREGWFSWFSDDVRGQSVRYRVTAPLWAGLKLHTVNGDVVVERASAGLVACTTNGEVRLREVGGTVSASSINGDVSLNLRRLDASSRLEVHTVNGDIAVLAPKTIAAAIDASTVHGSVTSDLPVVSSHRRRSGRLAGEINGGGGTLRLRSTNGDVRLRDD